MVVLLTRAAEDSARTRDRLERMGHRVAVAPVFSIEPTPAIWPDGAVDAVVATSSHAFRVLPPAWGPSREARRLLPLWLVGNRTELAARHAGYAGAATVAANAVMLALQMNKRSPGCVVYLAGIQRKSDIETALSKLEQPVHVAEVYAAVTLTALPDAAVSALSRADVPVVLHYSRRSAEVFATLVQLAEFGPRAASASHLCLSADVAMPLVALGWTAMVAPEPTEEALFGLLPAPT